MKRGGRTGPGISLVACFLIVLTLHLATSPIFVQGALTGTVSGRVVDEYGQSMRSVEIQVYSGEVYVKTGSTSSDGSFNITLDVGGSYKLYFSKAGYAEVTKTASVSYYLETIKLGNIVLLKALRLSYYVLSLVANPGDTLMLPFTVSNIGEDAEEVEFLVTKPDGWSTRILDKVGEVTKINLLAGTSLNLQLEILIPRTSAGDNRLSLTAAGKTSSTLDLTVKVGTGGTDSTEAKITCAEPWQVVSTGSTVTFELVITNNVDDDVYLLYINNPSLPNENWTVSFYSGTKEIRSIGVERYQSSPITLLVDIPEDASSADYPFRIYAAGSYSITSLVLAVTVRSVPRGIDLVYPFQSRTALIGQELSYPIKVVNEGEQDEKIFLGVNRTSDLMVWDISFSKEELMLPPKGGEWITLNVKSPGIVGAGIYTMNVTASTEDGEVKKVIPIVTEIVAQYILEIT
ncbi:MAG: carboxypeptidase regulatory-like domain-containing protein, partial [Candidatus Bathyarchaeota archaeon]|nr:carboxypeptidase regulatory-like domain-containing protein [Candidatus Bathyarchaeota archaeon]